MLPTLEPGDRIVVVPAATHPIRRGDVVVLRDPRDHERSTVKRVVGLPGETVEVRGGRLMIDGVAHLEGYATRRVGESIERLPASAYYVLGDNRSGSTDSRAFGPVDADLVRGVVVARIRPRLRLGLRAEPRPMTAAI